MEFTLTPEGGGTRLRVVESGFGSLDVPAEKQAKHVEQNVDGWSGGLRSLRDYLNGLAT